MKLVVDNDNVSTLREHTLRDIPAMLRKLADEIEGSGTPTEKLLVIIPVGGAFPDIRGYGDILIHEAVFELELAKHWFVNKCTSP